MEEKKNCDVCGPYKEWRHPDGSISFQQKDPYHIVILDTLNICSLCFKKILVDFSACAKAYIKSKGTE